MPSKGTRTVLTRHPATRAEQSATADGGPFIGFPSIVPSRPPLLSGVLGKRSMATIPPVIGHVEAHLGRIEPGAGYWRFPLGGYWLQVVAFRDQPRPGALTLCSVGLWH